MAERQPTGTGGSEPERKPPISIGGQPPRGDNVTNLPPSFLRNGSMRPVTEVAQQLKAPEPAVNTTVNATATTTPFGGERYLEDVPGKPKTYTRRAILGGAVVATAAVVVEETFVGKIKNFFFGGDHKVVVPGVTSNPESTAIAKPSEVPATNVPATEVPATPEAPTQVPTEAPAHSPEQGLYASVNEMPLPSEVKENLEKLFEGYEVSIVNKKSILALEDGLKIREKCSELGGSNPNEVPCPTTTKAFLNTTDYSNAAELMDALGPAGLELVAKRDGGTPLIKVYDGNSGVIKDIPITDPSKVIMVYKLLNAPQQNGSKEKTIIQLSQAFGGTYVLQDLGEGYKALEVRIYGTDYIGNELDKTDYNRTASIMGNIVAMMALPGLKPSELDGSAPYAVSMGEKQTVGKQLAAELDLITMPNKSLSTSAANNVRGIVVTDGKHNYNMANGQPFTRRSIQ